MQEPSQPRMHEMPVREKERIEVVDILRGFAVFGILVANMAVYSGQPLTLPPSKPLHNFVVYLSIRFFVEAKFYSLFSFLFGWGMAFQMARIGDHGAFLKRFARRLMILFMIGLIHVVFIWYGDILALYALLGFLLLVFRKRSSRFIFVAIFFFLALSLIMVAPGAAFDDFRTWYQNATAFMRSARIADSVYIDGTFAEVAQRRTQDFLIANSFILYSLGNVFGMFLLGLAAGKQAFFRNLNAHLPWIRKAIWISLIIGATFNAAYVSSLVLQPRIPPAYFHIIRVGSRTIGAPAMMLFYVFAIVLLYQNVNWKQRLAPLAPVGRMALSNYLLQSVVATWIFYGYGLGLYGNIDVTAGLILTIVIYVAQIRFSAWWFERYQFGPMEWIWRSLTYGRLQPFRIGATYSDSPLRADAIVKRVLNRFHPLARFAAVWAVLLVWAFLLFMWNQSIQDQKNFSQSVENALQSRVQASEVAAPTIESVVDALSPLATPRVQSRIYNPGPIAASGDLVALAVSFRQERAFSDLITLTGPTFEGRQAGSVGGRAAGDYLARQFMIHGLQPAGENGTFFQSFPVPYSPLAEIPTLEVIPGDGEVLSYQNLEDFFTWARDYSGTGSIQGDVIWVNNCEHHDFDEIDVIGEIAFCRQVPGVRADRNAIEHGAEGVLLLSSLDLPMDFAFPRFDPLVPEPIPLFFVSDKVAEGLLNGSGLSLADLSLTFTPRPLNTVARMEVRNQSAATCAQGSCEGRNVLGVLPGRDPEFADEVIIVGAHYDHMGKAPGGTVWAGADDDASGVAVLLEIARAWHTQGYMPRRTVLFAAWDAEELGLIGSQYYTDHPSYPLENTVAMLQMDMVGVGEDTLAIDSDSHLADQIAAAASAFGIETELSNHGGSDHVPFMRANVPASAISWVVEPDELTHYHRPLDKPAIIDHGLLEKCGKIAMLTLLGMSEGSPAIDDLLTRRSASILAVDLNAFLETSTISQRASNEAWFQDLQTLQPTSMKYSIERIEFEGKLARGLISMEIETGPESGRTTPKKTRVSLPVRFVFTLQGWLWDGPDLVPVAGHVGEGEIRADRKIVFNIFHPSTGTASYDQLADAAEAIYRRVVRRLGLSEVVEADILLFQTPRDLRFFTKPASKYDLDFWISENEVRIPYRKHLAENPDFEDALVEFVMANAGIDPQAVPWLWQGLPIVMRTYSGDTYEGQMLLQDLKEALELGEEIPQNVSAWAATEFARTQLGWRGIGRLIVSLGRVCQNQGCEQEQDLDSVMTSILGFSSSNFREAWQNDWRARLAAVQGAIDEVLAQRVEAILAGDESAFIGSLDATNPSLIEDQRGWFNDLPTLDLGHVAMSASPTLLLENGDIIGDVTLDIQAIDVEGESYSIALRTQVLFKYSGQGLRWAGYPFENLRNEYVEVFYPESLATTAQEVVAFSNELIEQAYTELGGRPSLIPIKLFPSEQSFRSSFWEQDLYEQTIAGRTAPHQSIRLLVSPSTEFEALQPELARQILRSILFQSGLDVEWLLEGLSTYLLPEYDNRTRLLASTQYLPKLVSAYTRGRLYPLEAFPELELLGDEERRIASAQAVDVLLYLIHRYGSDALKELLQQLRRGSNFEDAWTSTMGISMEVFEREWLDSLEIAHSTPAWIDIAAAFDPEAASSHMGVLVSPAFAGRQAGSSGAREAAKYIAEWFESYELEPVVPIAAGDDDPTSPPTSFTLELDLAASGTRSSSSQALSYHQSFPVLYTNYTRAPRIEFLDLTGERIEDFRFRVDFLPLPQAYHYQGPVEAPLVWIHTEDYGDMDLDGRIVLRKPTLGIETEIANAVEHGAEGLILIGVREELRDFLPKDPYPLSNLPEYGVPVFEIGLEAFDRLLPKLGHTRVSISQTPPAFTFDVVARLDFPMSEPQVIQETNVLGFLQGADPHLRHELVILGTHYDHVGDDPDTWICPQDIAPTQAAVDQDLCEIEPGLRYPGANDNASGVGVMLEIVRLWSEQGYHPSRSVLFAAWGAQEAGEVGSNYYIEQPIFPIEQTIAMVQIDGVGGGAGYYLEANAIIEREGLLISNITAIEDLVDGKLTLNLIPEKDVVSESPYNFSELFRPRDEATDRSDQIPFREAGVPSILLHWRRASEMNWPEARSDEVELDRIGISGRMVTLLLMLLAQ